MQPLLEQKIALITGAASGIGRATALVFAREGATPVLADVDEDGGQETARMVREKGGKTRFVRADVSQAEAVAQVVDEVVAQYGRLDCAFNNAGVAGALTRTADVTEEDFDRLTAVNFKGVWLCLKYEIRQMLTQGGGVIVNTASAAGLVGTSHMPVYGATKHAVIGLTKSAAVEYGRKGIRINAVCPSVIETPMVSDVFEQLPKFKENTIRLNPSKRLGRAEEVAEAVAWLCSDKASFVNGAILSVDGGFVAQ